MTASRPGFIITIDTEGDNLWAKPEPVTTENANFLPRFQALCEQYEFKPTYLANYEMVNDSRFQSFGHAVLEKGTAEIGLHIHPWDSPPLDTARQDTCEGQHYLFELSDTMLSDKIDYLHNFLVKTFGIQPVSHRAGRWGFDERVAKALAERGYLVDCSVTPGVSWRRYKGDPNGEGGSDYTEFPRDPYFMDLSNLKRRGASHLLQVPVTIRPHSNPMVRIAYRLAKTEITHRIVHRLMGPSHLWLRPTGSNLKQMLALVAMVLAEGAPVLEFMLHSSEFMPGGSPRFATETQIEVLYEHLDTLFEYIASRNVEGMTLAEYRETWNGGEN